MIEVFDTSELLTTLVVYRSELLKRNKNGVLSYKRLFNISHRITYNNHNIRFSINTNEIDGCCEFFKFEHDKNGRIIIPYNISNERKNKLSQYMPRKEIRDIFKKYNF